MDFDGDGSIDQVIDNGFGQSISYDYSQAGIYLPVITVVDTDNISHRNDLVVGIESEAQRNLLLQQVWNGMNAALVSANLELAKEHLFTEDTVGGYGLVWYFTYYYHLWPISLPAIHCYNQLPSSWNMASI